MIVSNGPGGPAATLTVDGRPVMSELVLSEVAQPAPGATSASAAVTGTDFARYQLTQRRNSGASWFYWIGALLIINSVLYAAHIEWGFVIGLGITQVIDGVAIATSDTVRTPICVGAVLYALDGLLFVVAEDWLALAFHVFALVGLISGWRAARELRRIEARARRLRP